MLLVFLGAVNDAVRSAVCWRGVPASSLGSVCAASRLAGVASSRGRLLLQGFLGVVAAVWQALLCAASKPAAFVVVAALSCQSRGRAHLLICLAGASRASWLPVFPVPGLWRDSLLVLLAKRVLFGSRYSCARAAGGRPPSSFSCRDRLLAGGGFTLSAAQCSFAWAVRLLCVLFFVLAAAACFCSRAPSSRPTAGVLGVRCRVSAVSWRVWAGRPLLAGCSVLSRAAALRRGMRRPFIASVAGLRGLLFCWPRAVRRGVRVL